MGRIAMTVFVALAFVATASALPPTPAPPGDKCDATEMDGTVVYCPKEEGDSKHCYPGEPECVPLWLEEGGFVAVLVAVMIIFWALALVCEEFFVPALNIMCVEAKIPDDVAGATFMAAGASCPELFLAFISIFVDHSTLGLGVVVGSEVFNQMIICAASVYYAPGGVLALEWRVVTRECLFYTIACLMLLWVCINKRCGLVDEGEEVCPDAKGVPPDPDNEHIDIPWWESLILVLFYVVYALVASYFNTSIVPMMCPMNAAQNPVSQNEADTYVQITDESKPRSSSHARGRGSSYSETGRKKSRALSAMLPNTAAALDHQRAVGDAISDVERSGQALECYLYKKNRLYAKMQLSSLKWMLRWCTIDDNKFTTCKNRDTKEGLVHMDIYTARSVDIYKVEQHQFRITTGDGEEFFFRAQSAESMHECMEKIKALIAKYSQLSMPERQDLLAKAGNSAYGDEHEEHEGLIDWPKNPTAMAVSLHLLLFPLKFLFHYTIPDMHVNPKGYWGAIFSCVVWMALLSYGMAVMCNFIGGWLQIPQLIIGLTLGAVGTSFPNVFASILVAQQGQGNMAVCAAFGANLFNIFIGLGLPWLTYAIIFGDYAVMAFKGVRVPAILLIVFVVVFMIYMMATNFVMTKNAGYVMVVVYIAYLVLAVLNVWKDY